MISLSYDDDDDDVYRLLPDGVETFEDCKIPFGVAAWDILGFKTESISSEFVCIYVYTSTYCNVTTTYYT